MVWCVLVASILAALYSMELVRRANYSYARLNRAIRYSRWLKSYRQQIDMHKSIAATLVKNIDDMKKESLAWQGTCAGLRKEHSSIFDENQSLSIRNKLLEARNKAIEALVNTGNAHSDDTTSNHCIHCRQLGLRVCLADAIHGKKSGYSPYIFPPIIEKICTNTACGHDCCCHGDDGCLIKGCGCPIVYPKQGGSHASPEQKEKRVDSNPR